MLSPFTLVKENKYKGPCSTRLFISLCCAVLEEPRIRQGKFERGECVRSSRVAPLDGPKVSTGDARPSKVLFMNHDGKADHTGWSGQSEIGVREMVPAQAQAAT